MKNVDKVPCFSVKMSSEGWLNEDMTLNFCKISIDHT